MAVDRYLSDAEKIALLQFLDQETLAELLGGQDSGYGDALARINAMGGDAATAAQDFLADIESGLPYQEVKKNFESAVSKGIYNLDTNTADEVSKGVLTALTNRQKGGSSAASKAAKELGFPELAFLAPSMGKQGPSTANPYSGASEKQQKYMADMEALKSQKLKETGGNSFLRNFAKVGGTAVAGLGAGLAAAALPATLPLAIGAGVAAGGFGGVTASGILGRILPDSSDLKDKKKQQQLALMKLQEGLSGEESLQKARATGWQRGYDETLKKSGGAVSPYDIQKLQLMSLLSNQG